MGMYKTKCSQGSKCVQCGRFMPARTDYYVKDNGLYDPSWAKEKTVKRFYRKLVIKGKAPEKSLGDFVSFFNEERIHQSLD